MSTPIAEASSVSVDRRRLRSTLKRERQVAGLTQDQVAEQMDWSLSKVIRIETGAVTVSTNDVKALLTLYGITDKAQVEEIVGLARVARQRPWWSAYRDHYHVGFLAYLDLEAGASSLRFFQPALIPGLLQTPDYARAAIEGTAGEPMQPDQIDLEIEVRSHRQRHVFQRPKPPEIIAILDEAALRRVCGSREVMRGQLQHLTELSRQDLITIQVVPFTAGIPAGNYGAFVIIDFDGSPEDRALHVEHVSRPETVQGTPQTIEPYRRLFERVRTVSLSEKDSIALIARVADELA
jgi:transcriptional regulator with XRE-family HTH domain